MLHSNDVNRDCFLCLFKKNNNKRQKISLFIYLYNDVDSNNPLKNILIDLESKIISKI